jgi:hypothetical protein
MTVPVLATEDGATKSSKLSCPTSRSTRRRIWVPGVADQVADTRGLVNCSCFSSRTSPSDDDGGAFLTQTGLDGQTASFGRQVAVANTSARFSVTSTLAAGSRTFTAFWNSVVVLSSLL